MNEMTYQHQSNRQPIACNTQRVLKMLSGFEQDETSRMLMERILDREEVGAVKYGKTMDRNDYEKRDWLLHLLEELLDGAGYAMAAGEDEVCENLLSDARHVQRTIDSLIK